MQQTQADPGRHQAGFALVVALLTLLILTFLGLTLATTTSTELQIATNFRRAQQALFNAEAGIEIARRALRNQMVWDGFVPVARTLPVAAPPTLMTGAPVGRDLENADCDPALQGYGAILDLPGIGRFENQASYLGQTMNGSITIWMRRPPDFDAAGALVDYNNGGGRLDRVVVTSEGTAPFVGPQQASGAYAVINRAVRVIEAELSLFDPDCENRSAQVGGGSLGAGYDPCYAVGAEGLPKATVAGAQVTPVEITPDQN
jgi:hypothetical protein